MTKSRKVWRRKTARLVTSELIHIQNWFRHKKNRFVPRLQLFPVVSLAGGSTSLIQAWHQNQHEFIIIYICPSAGVDQYFHAELSIHNVVVERVSLPLRWKSILTIMQPLQRADIKTHKFVPCLHQKFSAGQTLCLNIQLLACRTVRSLLFSQNFNFAYQTMWIS